MPNMDILNLIPQTVSLMLVFYLFVKVIDFVTGVLKTWKESNYKSRKMRDGIIRWIAELVAISFVMAFDYVLGLQFYLTGLTVSLFIYKEAGSVLENLGQLGVQLPNAIKNHLEALNKDEEMNVDDNQTKVSEKRQV